MKTTFSEKLSDLSHMSLEDLIRTVTNGLVSIVMKIFIALVIFWIGRWLIRRIRKMMNRIMVRREVDISLRAFLMNLVSITLMLFLIIVVIGILGIDTTSFIALFASAGLALGVALSGTLQNFAGGVMILLFRPFRVGDFIEAQGKSGTVKEIQLIHTVLNTVDNQTILLPNGPVSTGIINNYSREPQRQVEWTFGIAYGDDYQTAKETIAELLKKDPRVLDEKGLTIHLNSLGDSSVNILVRAWVNAPDFWGLFWDMNEQVYRVFAEKGLNIPFPQMDVHLYKGDE
ncbi:mechanosensitive ion channel domain-containing protein [uncultured Rikenella sp.]|uniref:mechanosensitive ion channel family protein n=1 Tax=uncultured Rikenella sp. TaxID=368003 RepID=UPI0026096AF2|nr:mechanosensitive ion channel domain-containing protein [uncultured Rikenella sp.]